MTPEQQAALREPFPPSMVGVKPQPYKKDSPKGTCKECGKYHGLPALHLDFVGHGATTDRLLSVDPAWTWEPFAVDETGLPLLDRSGNLWIRLTIGGVTRPGVGDGASVKEKVGDAIRNAAMRFGVALDLWINGQEDEKSDDTPTEVVAPTHVPAPTERHDALKARVAALTVEQRATFDEWKSGHRFVWPWSEPACVAIETQVNKIVGGGGDAPFDDGRAQGSLAASPGPSGEEVGSPDTASTGLPDGPTPNLLDSETF